jgi:hypothetical protein
MESKQAAGSRFEGGCLCGAVRWRASGAARNLCCCHCRSCRLASGAPFVAWGTFDTGCFEILTGELRQHQSSAQAVRGFCARCGTTITYRNTLREEELDVALATLDDPDALAPRFHIWTSHKLSWVQLSDGLPQFEEWGASS